MIHNEIQLGHSYHVLVHCHAHYAGKEGEQFKIICDQPGNLQDLLRIIRVAPDLSFDQH